MIMEHSFPIMVAHTTFFIPLCNYGIKGEDHCRVSHGGSLRKFNVFL